MLRFNICSFIDCRASGNGGGVSANGVALYDVYFCHCNAGLEGGGLCFYNTPKISTNYGVFFIGNHAKEGENVDDVSPYNAFQPQNWAKRAYAYNTTIGYYLYAVDPTLEVETTEREIEGQEVVVYKDIYSVPEEFVWSRVHEVILLKGRHECNRDSLKQRVIRGSRMDKTLIEVNTDFTGSVFRTCALSSLRPVPRPIAGTQAGNKPIPGFSLLMNCVYYCRFVTASIIISIVLTV